MIPSIPSPPASHSWTRLTRTFPRVQKTPDGESASPDSESLAKTLEKSLGLNNDQADNVDAPNDDLKGKLIITKHRPKIPDCIATDDEDWEPPVWHAWDEWDQKVNAQEDWTWHNTLKYKAKKGQFDDHEKVYKKKSKKRRHYLLSQTRWPSLRGLRQLKKP